MVTTLKVISGIIIDLSVLAGTVILILLLSIETEMSPGKKTLPFPFNSGKEINCLTLSGRLTSALLQAKFKRSATPRTKFKEV
jgi:hypothetical protein